MTVISMFGNGKGKTSSGIGQCVRSLGHDSNDILIIQFNKNDSSIGEYNFFFKKHPSINCKIIQYGTPCRHYKLRAQKRCMECGECSQDERLRRTKIEQAIGKLKRDAPNYTVILLDEILVSRSMGDITIEDIKEIVNLDPEKTYILTGRIWGENGQKEEIEKEIYEISDYMSEVISWKHPYQRGISARKGLEY